MQSGNHLAFVAFPLPAKFLAAVVLCLGFSRAGTCQSDQPSKLAAQVQGFLKKYCAQCHTGTDPESAVEDYDVLDYKSLTKKRENEGKVWQYVQPGAKGEAALKTSELWKRAGVKGVSGGLGNMPPKKAKAQPTDKERKEVLQAWLEIGAPAVADAKPDAPAFPDRERDSELWVAARRVLDTKCMKCHDGPNSSSGVNLLINDHASLTTTRVKSDRNDEPYARNKWERDPWHYARPGVASKGLIEESLLWDMINDDRMPKSGAKLTAEEKSAIKSWLVAGAPAPAAIPRRIFLSRVDEENAVLKYLQIAEPSDRRFLRFFSVAHLHNNATIRLEDLAISRAGLSKLLNSLSWRESIAVPTIVPETQDAVLAIDLRQLGWKRQTWDELVRDYPYFRHWQPLIEEADCKRPVVRADWFTAVACRPPWYHRLLELPEQASDLEKKLGIDFVDNFLTGRLWRAGYHGASTTTSGFRVVERQNIEVFPGGYWKSYDFGVGPLSSDTAKPLVYPFGPTFKKNPFPQLAFRHDGSEIIFSLPNGMQGYMVTDRDGKRMDEPPTWVLKDKNEFSGGPALVNGISCIACHANGMQSVTDQVLDEIIGKKIPGGEFGKRLYPEKATLNKLLKSDQFRFAKSVKDATNSFLRGLGNPSDEVVFRVHSRYHANLSLEDAAHELRLHDPNEMRNALEADLFKGLSLKVRLLREGGRVTRAEWEKSFQEASARLDKMALASPNGR